MFWKQGETQGNFWWLSFFIELFNLQGVYYGLQSKIIYLSLILHRAFKSDSRNLHSICKPFLPPINSENIGFSSPLIIYCWFENCLLNKSIKIQWNNIILNCRYQILVQHFIHRTNDFWWKTQVKISRFLCSWTKAIEGFLIFPGSKMHGFSPNFPELLRI